MRAFPAEDWGRRSRSREERRPGARTPGGPPLHQPPGVPLAQQGPKRCDSQAIFLRDVLDDGEYSWEHGQPMRGARKSWWTQDWELWEPQWDVAASLSARAPQKVTPRARSYTGRERFMEGHDDRDRTPPPRGRRPAAQAPVVQLSGRPPEDSAVDTRSRPGPRRCDSQAIFLKGM
mmetsp:Transcript_9133/g.21318  ORF Transcript_9133/g.21318 Transcript_9133/m.21318 type:complete len:176 (+) Transcript_9133:94-621(+)